MGYSPAQRRLLILDTMSTLGQAGVDCSACVGTCCTFEANSMQITALEAWDMLVYLRSELRFGADLKASLEAQVRSERLDVELPLPRGQNFRRRYTCPFFSGKQLGCTISRRHKPYGCLAFNPRSKGQVRGGDCASEQSLLALQRDTNAQRRQEDSAELGLESHVGKWPIPLAILKIWDVFEDAQESAQ